MVTPIILWFVISMDEGQTKLNLTSCYILSSLFIILLTPRCPSLMPSPNNRGSKSLSPTSTNPSPNITGPSPKNNASPLSKQNALSLSTNSNYPPSTPARPASPIAEGKSSPRSPMHPSQAPTSLQSKTEIKLPSSPKADRYLQHYLEMHLQLLHIEITQISTPLIIQHPSPNEYVKQ